MRESWLLRYRDLLASALLFWLPVGIFFRLADDVLEREPFRFDAPILWFIHGFASPALDRLAVAVTALGSASVVVVVAGLIAARLLYVKAWPKAAFFMAGVGGAAAADAVLKLIFHRARPELWPRIVAENDYSFPSGHAMITVSLALSVIILLWDTRWRWAAVAAGAIYVLAVSLSRLYLGVHYPTDILAGWCASAAWVMIAATISRVRSRH